MKTPQHRSTIKIDRLSSHSHHTIAPCVTTTNRFQGEVAKNHVDVWLSVAPQRDNVLHLAEIIEFAAAEGLRTDLTNFVHWPKHLAVNNLPDPEKVAAVTT